MKIICDENIQFAHEFFGVLPSGTPAELVLKSGRDICQADLVDVDALMVRSVTQVNSDLLDGTPVAFVGTATIGTDHIDTDYLHTSNIAFASAAGCSKHTVAQYVLSAIHKIRPQYFNHTVPILGIVGFGHIGSVLAGYAKRLGWQVMVCDPYKTVVDFPQVALAELVASCDVVSLHVPLTTHENSKHPTHHLINAEILAHMPAKTLLINTARGKVVSESDLFADIEHSARDVVLDVFEHEPRIDAVFLQKLKLATPHIAGYSLEGKARGTQFIYQAWCEWLGAVPTRSIHALLPANPCTLSSDPNAFAQRLYGQVPKWYDIGKDDAALRHCIQSGLVEPACFDGLRKAYSLANRREWLI